MYRARYTERVLSFHAISTCHSPWSFMVLPIWKFSKPHPFGIIMEVSLHGCAQLNHWLMDTELLFSTEVQGLQHTHSSFLYYWHNFIKSLIQYLLTHTPYPVLRIQARKVRHFFIFKEFHKLVCVPVQLWGVIEAHAMCYLGPKAEVWWEPQKTPVISTLPRREHKEGHFNWGVI